MTISFKVALSAWRRRICCRAADNCELKIAAEEQKTASLRIVVPWRAGRDERMPSAVGWLAGTTSQTTLVMSLKDVEFLMMEVRRIGGADGPLKSIINKVVGSLRLLNKTRQNNRTRHLRRLPHRRRRWRRPQYPPHSASFNVTHRRSSIIWSQDPTVPARFGLPLERARADFPYSSFTTAINFIIFYQLRPSLLTFYCIRRGPTFLSSRE